MYFRSAGVLLVLVLGMLGIACDLRPTPDRDGCVVLTENGSWGYAGRHAFIVNNVLYYSYLDTAGHTWVSSFSASGEHKQYDVWAGQANLHSANPLVIRPDGRIQVFLDKGAYFDKRIRWKVSARPDDISEFGGLRESGVMGTMQQGRQFYPLVHAATGRMYLVINARAENGDRYTAMWISADGGDTFTGYRDLWVLGKGLDSNRCYTRAFIRNDEIHFVTARVGWGEPIGPHHIGRVEGIYYIKYNVLDSTFYRSSGKAVFETSDLPVSDVSLFDEVWHWEKDGNRRQRALWSDVVADDAGRPYVAFTVHDAAPAGTSTVHTGCWARPDSAGNWRFFPVADLARGWNNRPERKNYGMAIDPEDPCSVLLSTAMGADAGVSRIVRMHTDDLGDRWKVDTSISDPGRASTVVIPQVIGDGRRFVDALWLEGRMADWTDYHTRIVAHISQALP